MTFHPGYAATQISSNLNGSTKQFGWLQASATKVAQFLKRLPYLLISFFKHATHFGFLWRLLLRPRFGFFLFRDFRDKLGKRRLRNILAGAFLGPMTTRRNGDLFSGTYLCHGSVIYLEVFRNFGHGFGPHEVVKLFPC